VSSGLAHEIQANRILVFDPTASSLEDSSIGAAAPVPEAVAGVGEVVAEEAL